MLGSRVVWARCGLGLGEVPGRLGAGLDSALVWARLGLSMG